MAIPSIKDSEDLSALKSTVAATSALIAQLLSCAPSREKEASTAINALDLAHDSASLIRAHTTKLSLLVINKPFTPSAIKTVLQELAMALSGLATAIEGCTESRYTKAMSKELQWRGSKLFKELGTFVDAIPVDGEILSGDAKTGTGNAAGRGSLASTGLVWDACDTIVELKTIGIAGLTIRKAEEYRELLKDALQELQEWGEETSDSEDEGDRSDGEDGAADPAQAAVDDIFGSQRHIPADDPSEIRPRLDSAQKRLRLMVLMFQAVVKRRLKTLPALPHPNLPPELSAVSAEDPGIIGCLDELLEVMKSIPAAADDLAGAFYELDREDIDARMEQCFFAGFAVAEILIKSWEGENDEFTTWARKFQIAMKKGW